MGNNTSPSQFVGWTAQEQRREETQREKLLPHYFWVGSQWNTALMSAVRRDRGLKEIHTKFFLPALHARGKRQEGPCLWEVTCLRPPGARAVQEASLTMLRDSTGGTVATYCGREWDGCEQEIWHEQGLANSMKLDKGQSGEGFWGWTRAMRSRYNSRGKFLTENTRTQWTWCPHLWVHRGINRSGVTRAKGNKSSFGTSTLGWAGEGWGENLQRNKVVALGGVRGCICRRVLSMITWLWKPEGKQIHAHWWRSLYTFDSIS